MNIAFLSIFNPKPVYAGTQSLGGEITGVGVFQTVGSGPSTLLGTFLSSLVTTLTIVGSLAFVVYFFIGTLTWITAGGDKGKIGQAQSQMTQGAIGLIALVAAYFVIGIVGAVLGLDLLNPYKMFKF
jgi:hypothetical protein